LQDNFDTFAERFGGGMALFPRIINSSTQFFVTEEKAVEVEKFFQEHPVEEAERSIKQSLETIRNHKQWLARDSKVVAEFLASK
jgi:aminopeptidase N